MKIKDFERVIFTPGVCRNTLTSDYYEVDNMLVVGVSGSGKTTLLQAIMNSIISSNEPRQFSLVHMDMYTNGINPYCNENRVIPCMDLMHDIYAEEGSYAEKCQKFLDKLFIVHEGLLCGDAVDHEGAAFSTKLIIVIDGFDRLDKIYQQEVFAIMKAHKGIKFILGTQNVEQFRKYLYLVPYRIVTRTSSDTSNEVLHCNIGNTQADVMGSCWFYDVSNPGVYKKYNVEYMPESLVNRMLKVHAGRSNNAFSISNVVREQLNGLNTARRYIMLKYDADEANLREVYLDNILSTHKYLDDKAGYAIFYDIVEDMRRNGWKAGGPVSIYNTEVVDRIISKAERRVAQGFPRPIELSAYLALQLKNEIMQSMKTEGIKFFKIKRTPFGTEREFCDTVTRGKTDTQHASFSPEDVARAFNNLPTCEREKIVSTLFGEERV